MKAMFAGFAAAIVLAIGSWAVLNQMGFSAADRYSTENVRLE